jgi:hypothetical protein
MAGTYSREMWERSARWDKQAGQASRATANILRAAKDIIPIARSSTEYLACSVNLASPPTDGATANISLKHDPPVIAAARRAINPKHSFTSQSHPTSDTVRLARGGILTYHPLCDMHRLSTLYNHRARKTSSTPYLQVTAARETSHRCTGSGGEVKRRNRVQRKK